VPDFREREGVGGVVPSPARLHDAPDSLPEEPPVAPDGLVRGFIHSSETSGAVDGPGIRYTLFLSGCPRRCVYCHNPDTWEMRMGEQVTAGQVADDIGKYVTFLRAASGGVTASGGEPLLQPRFVTALFRLVKTRYGLHTALDTSGYLGERASDELLDLTDLVLLDIKSGEPKAYRQVTGAELAPALAFARRLSDRGDAMWIRYVLVPGLTDQPTNIDAVASFVASLRGVERVEVLPYHSMGAHKYEALGLPYPLPGVPAPSAEAVEVVQEHFRGHGLTAL